jgi:predicted AlkP superfamily pyrophosphatase or phosphodiesterase
VSVSEGVDKVYNEGALGVESIFDVMRAEDVEFEYLVYPDVSTDVELTETLLSEVEKQSPKDVYLGQFISSDRDVHKAGVNSTDRVEITERIDEQIDAIRTACEKHLDNYNLCIIGDHGMMDVETYIDIYAKVTDYSDRKGLSMGQDFLLFLDSTLARFWFFTDEAKELLSQFVENELSNLGEIIDEDRAAQKRLPDDRRYGDLIWEASPGVLIYPDYFHRTEKYNAMHGYDSEVPEMKGFAITYGADAPESTSSDVELIDVCPTLCDLIGIAYPEKNEGKSMILE